MEWVKLGDIATFINGYAFKPVDWEDKGMPIIRIQNLTNKGAPFNYTKKEMDERFKVYYGDILISWSATLGVYEWHGEPAVLNQHIFKVQFDKIDVDKLYFRYMVEEALYRSVKYAHGSTMKHLTKKTFEEIVLPIPNKKAQIQITSLLRKIKIIIAKRREQIDGLDALVGSVFQDLLDSPNLKEVVLNDVILDKPCRLDSENEEPISYFDISSVNNKTHDIISEKIICKVEDRPGRAKQLIQSNDILVSNVRPNLKNIAYFRFDSSFTPVASTGFTVLRADSSKINPLFLYSFVTSDEFTNRLIMKSTGANYPAVSEKEVRRTRVPLPKLELQNRFAEYVTSIEAQKESLRASLSELETLFDAQMQAAFSGHLNQSY